MKTNIKQYFTIFVGLVFSQTLMTSLRHCFTICNVYFTMKWVINVTRYQPLWMYPYGYEQVVQWSSHSRTLHFIGVRRGTIRNSLSGPYEVQYWCTRIFCVYWNTVRRRWVAWVVWIMSFRCQTEQFEEHLHEVLQKLSTADQKAWGFWSFWCPQKTSKGEVAD